MIKDLIERLKEIEDMSKDKSITNLDQSINDAISRINTIFKNKDSEFYYIINTNKRYKLMIKSKTNNNNWNVYDKTYTKQDFSILLETIYNMFYYYSFGEKND